jgi:sarcosine oxidase
LALSILGPTYDAIVIGLGAMGSATLYQLSRRGARVLGIDRFTPPHAQGSSHGETRITRLAVGEGAVYVPFAQRSHEIWREIEAQLGVELLVQCGGLVLGPRDGGGELHGQSDFVAETIAVARQFGLAHDVLDACAIARRFPQFMLKGDELGCFEPSAGFVRPQQCIAAQLELARRAGADIVTGQAVTSIDADGAAVAVTLAAGTTYRAARAVVSAGAWNPALAGGRYAQALKVRRQALHWFQPEEPAHYAPGPCPIFIWSHGPAYSQAFYGIPVADAHSGVKVGTQQHEADTTPDTVDRAVSAAESASMHAAHVNGRLRGVTARRTHAAACLYTVENEARFVVDRHPRVAAATVVSACSGHGFKHSAALGEALAESLLEQRSTLDLAPFGLR